jgi:hypothetical protein
MENPSARRAALLLASRLPKLPSIGLRSNVMKRSTTSQPEVGEPENSPSATASAVESLEPPVVYIGACGALCDVFWWARGSAPRATDSK